MGCFNSSRSHLTVKSETAGNMAEVVDGAVVGIEEFLDAQRPRVTGALKEK